MRNNPTLFLGCAQLFRKKPKSFLDYSNLFWITVIFFAYSNLFWDSGVDGPRLLDASAAHGGFLHV